MKPPVQTIAHDLTLNICAGATWKGLIESIYCALKAVKAEDS